jgi:nicotinamidase-related amidase
MTFVLLLVDVQKDMLAPPEPVPDAALVGEAIKDLLGRARSAGTPVPHTKSENVRPTRRLTIEATVSL